MRPMSIGPQGPASPTKDCRVKAKLDVRVYRTSVGINTCLQHKARRHTLAEILFAAKAEP